MKAIRAAGSLPLPVSSPPLLDLVCYTLRLVCALFHTLIKAARLLCLSAGKVDETAAVENPCLRLKCCGGKNNQLNI